MSSRIPKPVKLDTGQRLLEFSGTGFAFGPQVLGIRNTEDKHVQFWPMQNLFDAKQPKCTSYKFKYKPWSLAFSQATPMVAIIEKKKEGEGFLWMDAIHLFNWERGTEIKRIRRRDYRYQEAHFSASGDSLVAGCTHWSSHEINLWSAPKWKRTSEMISPHRFLQMKYDGHEKTVAIISWHSYHSHHLLELRFLNVSTGVIAPTLEFHSEDTNIRHFRMSDDLRNIVAYAKTYEFVNDYLAVYRVEDQKRLWSKQIPVHECAISPNNQHLVTYYNDGDMLRFWDITTGRETRSPIRLPSAQRIGEHELGNVLAYDPSGRFLGLYDCVSGTINIIELSMQTPKPGEAKQESKRRRQPVTTSREMHQPKVQIQPSRGKPVKRVLGVLKSFQSITMTDLVNYSSLSVEETRNLVFELIADDLVAGRFDSESDSFVSATAASASKQIRSDGTTLARCMFCGKALGRALRAGDEVPCPSCGMINVG